MENHDGVFAQEAEIDNEIRSRNRTRVTGARTRPQSNTSNASSTVREQDENTHLLGDEPDNEMEESNMPEWFGYSELAGLPWWNKPSIFWLLPPFLLFTMAFGGILVPKLNLIQELICQDYFADKSINGFSRNFTTFDEVVDPCRDEEVSARVSLFSLYGNLCSGILAAITSPKLGALSDRYGRKKILVFTTAGTLVGEVITIIAAKYPDTVDVNWILVGYACDGLCGSFIVGMAIAHSYATDCTPPHKRNVAFAYFHACLFTGIAIGPMVAGVIIKKTGTVLTVFYIALVCHFIFIFFLLFCIPESLSKSRQEDAREKYRREMERLGPTADWINQLRSVNLLVPLKILWPTGPGTSSHLRWNLMLLAAIDMIMFGVAMGALSVIVIYLRLQFGWQSYESSRYTSIVNICRVFCLLVALPVITRLVRGKDNSARSRKSGSDLFDLTIIRIAIFFDMLGYLGYTLSRDGTLFTLSGVTASLGGIGSPTLGAALTKHVPHDRVGQLLGATGLLHAFARVIGPTIFNGIYYKTVGTYRQTVFVCLTATFGVAFLVSWFVRPHVYLEDIPLEENIRSEQSSEEEERTSLIDETGHPRDT